MAKDNRPKPKFAGKEKVLLEYEFGKEKWQETRYVHKRKWDERHGWTYEVGAIPNVSHRGALATVAESSLSKHP